MEEESISREEFLRLHKLLEETLKVSKENNYYLNRMRFWGRVSFWAKVFIWIIVLGVPILLYSYFAPILNIFPGGAGGGTASSSSLFGFPSPAEVLKSVHH